MDTVRVFLAGGVAVDVECASWQDDGKGFFLAFGPKSGPLDKPELLGAFQKVHVMAYLIVKAKAAE